MKKKLNTSIKLNFSVTVKWLSEKKVMKCLVIYIGMYSYLHSIKYLMKVIKINVQLLKNGI